LDVIEGAALNSSALVSDARKQRPMHLARRKRGSAAGSYVVGSFLMGCSSFVMYDARFVRSVG